MGEIEPFLKPVLKPTQNDNKSINLIKFKEIVMKTLTAKVVKYSRIIMFVLILAMFVVAAAAPEMTGTVGH